MPGLLYYQSKYQDLFICGPNTHVGILRQWYTSSYTIQHTGEHLP